MVYGAINERNREWYTRLGDVFDAIGDEQRRFNWLITDNQIVARSEGLAALSTGSRWVYEGGKQVVRIWRSSISVLRRCFRPVRCSPKRMDRESVE